MSQKWQAEQKVLKKLQLHFTFNATTFRQLKHQAAQQNMNTSDVVRQIIGLSYEKNVRPRIGLSFSLQELNLLAKRYELSVDDVKSIKTRVVEEVGKHYSKN